MNINLIIIATGCAYIALGLCFVNFPMNQFTPEWYERYQAKQRNRAEALRVGARAKHEELKDAGTGKAHHKTSNPTLDGKGHPKYRISIDLLISDRRRRDIDGNATTLLDSLVHAVGRFAPVGAGDQPTGGQRAEGPRGSFDPGGAD